MSHDLQKLEKILRLAERSAGNKAEAEIAFRMAQRLAKRLKLRIYMVSGEYKHEPLQKPPEPKKENIKRAAEPEAVKKASETCRSKRPKAPFYEEPAKFEEFVPRADVPIKKPLSWTFYYFVFLAFKLLSLATA